MPVYGIAYCMTDHGYSQRPRRCPSLEPARDVPAGARPFLNALLEQFPDARVYIRRRGEPGGHSHPGGLLFDQLPKGEPDAPKAA